MTVFEALQWASGKLKPIVSASAMLDAEVLLSHAVRVNKAWVFSHLDQELRAHEETAFTDLVNRRAKREPVAHLVGTKEFFGRTFRVTPATLIPRPATEALVEEAVKIVHANSQILNTNSLFADIGTGSGAIAITLAAETGLHAIATDVSRDALFIAESNAAALGVADKVDFRLGNLLEPVVAIFRKLGSSSPVKHLVICANLPYLTAEKVACAEPDVKDYEPHSALVAGSDGLECYWQLFRYLKANREILPERVTVLIEIDPDQADAALAMIRHDFPAASPRVVKDLSGVDRIIVAET